MQTSYANHLRLLDVIIWDEASMIPKKALVAVHNLFTNLTGETNPNILFGGKVVLLGGDFRQVLPVVRRGSYGDIIQETIKTWSEWRQFQCLSLQTNIRCQNVEYQQLILRIGNGEAMPANVTSMARQYGWMANNLEDLINHVYSDFDNLAEKAILACKNTDVRIINQMVLQRFKDYTANRNRAVGQAAPFDRISLSADSIEPDGVVNLNAYPIEFLNNYNAAGFSQHHLRLVEGGIYMLIRNINIDYCLTNGQRVKLIRVHPGETAGAPSFLVVSIASPGFDPQRTFTIPKVTLRTNPENNDLPFILKRKQFPIVPGFAMTINKSQGQSFSTLSLHLNPPVFAHGQLYVAMSRIRDPQHLRIYHGESDGNQEIILRNIVYQSML